MQHDLAVDFGEGVENRGIGTGELAFRCGLPFRGNGRPIRNEGPPVRVPASLMTGALIEVAWSRPVSWRKRIRFSKR